MEVGKELPDGGLTVNQVENEMGVEPDDREMTSFIRELLQRKIYTCQECEELMIFNGLNPNLLDVD